MYVTSRDIYDGNGGQNNHSSGATESLDSARYSALKKGRRSSYPTDV